MTTIYTTLKLVGKHNTIDFLDDQSGYALVSWAPSIAARERRMLGNYSAYTNVEEVITINIWGNSVSQALDRLDAINNVLEQAEAWYLGENVDPVLVKVQMMGSQLEHPLEAVVLGRASGYESWMQLQPTFNQDLIVYEIQNVEVRFTRRGLWLGEETTVSTASDNINPSIMSVDMGERLDRLCPTTVKITGFDPATPMLGSGFLILSGTPVTSTYGNNIGIYAANSLTSTEFSIIDDSTNKAHLDDIQQIDAASDQTGVLTLSNLYAEVTRISVFAAIRNNSTTTTWRARVKSYGYATITDRWRNISAESQKPQVIYLGSLGNQSGTHINLDVEFETDGTTGTLDVNYIVVVGHDQSTNYIAIDGVTYSTDGFSRALVVADRTNTHKTPLLYIETSLS